MVHVQKHDNLDIFVNEKQILYAHNYTYYNYLSVLI